MDSSMDRKKPPLPPPRGPRHRLDSSPRVLILCDDVRWGNWVRTQMMGDMRDTWVDAYSSLMDYRGSIDCNIIYDVTVYCPLFDEEPETVVDMVNHVLLYCPEAKIVLYSPCNQHPTDKRILAIVQQSQMDKLVETIRGLFDPKAA